MRRIAVGTAMVWLILSVVLLVGLEVEGWGEHVWGGKADDFAYVPVALCPLGVGLLIAQRWSVLLVGGAFIAAVLIEQALWHDDPVLSGTDDMSPMMGMRVEPVRASARRPAGSAIGWSGPRPWAASVRRCAGQMSVVLVRERRLDRNARSSS